MTPSKGHTARPASERRSLAGSTSHRQPQRFRCCHGSLSAVVRVPAWPSLMAMQIAISSYKRHRFPPEIITHSVWLYCCFNTSFREVEGMLLKREITPGLAHRSHKGSNNRAASQRLQAIARRPVENSHLPFPKREKTMQGYCSPGHLQRFVSIHSAIRDCFFVPSCRRSALTIRYHRLETFDARSAVSHKQLKGRILRFHYGRVS